MGALSELERDCLRRYCAMLRARLGERLLEVRMFGSAARGDMWPAHSPMHSDVDLLVITPDDVGADEQEQLLDETYPPRAFLRHVATAGVSVWQTPR